ncbi:Pentatricopeptide repeat-containing protein [Platanthera guangdongensis]|uniref:Pentatricopeptide repeat-containing protein n=1 Tax=Platanthera guangdongensis TaxID=2320717 RepID=A0ABR2LJD1_9ASPA
MGHDIIFCNRMIIHFTNARDLISARQLFEGMPERDVVSWNSMMTAYYRNECSKEALQLFSEMQRSHFKPNHTSFSTVLSSCGKVRALDQGRQIHGLSIKTQSSANLFVGTSLITMYSRCTAPDCMIKAFEEIKNPSTASWNALISGFVLNRQVSNARKMFDLMPSRNVVSWTSMIRGYAEVSKMRNAIDLFEAMPVRNHVSWGVILGGLVKCKQFDEALVFFSRMLNSGVRITTVAIIEITRTSSYTRNLKLGIKIHGCAIKSGFHLDHMIESSLVSMYCNCLEMEEAKLEFMKMEKKSIESCNSLLTGYMNISINDARRCFDSMNNRDDLTCNSMINGYLKNSRLDDAMELLRMMPEPTMETLTALMYNFIQNGNLEEARRLFSVMSERDVVAYTTMVFGFLEGGQLEDAIILFNDMPEKNVVSYNVMISGYLHHGKTKEAYEIFMESPVKDEVSWDSVIIGFVRNGLYVESFQLYMEMAFSDIRPSELITASLLSASSRISILILGEEIHALVVKLGHESHSIIGNSLINMYGKCGDMLTAKFVFDRMEEHDLVAWNAMIHSYACNGLGKEAVDMFEKMKMRNVKPDDATFLGILFACSHNSLLEEAQVYFNSMCRDYGIQPEVAHYACLVDLQCRMGMAEAAEVMVRSMPFEPDSSIWTSILSGCRLNCDVKLAERAANQLFSWDPLDRMPYKHLIGVYVSAGRWADAERMRSRMDELTSDRRPGCSWV